MQWIEDACEKCHKRVFWENYQLYLLFCLKEKKVGNTRIRV
ncbi:hypothetical protein [Bacillus cereus]|nr:hypothetical protein [Bacillus cereus]